MVSVETRPDGRQDWPAFQVKFKIIKLFCSRKNLAVITNAGHVSKVKATHCRWIKEENISVEIVDANLRGRCFFTRK